MELREHSLWLAKRDTVCPSYFFSNLLSSSHLQGKDETFLCSLSNFDVYYVGKAHHKSPKPFVFAVKSTDNLSLFESATDYVHFFSCNQKEGETWMQAILLARVSPITSSAVHILISSYSLMCSSRSVMFFSLPRQHWHRQLPNHFLVLVLERHPQQHAFSQRNHS